MCKLFPQRFNRRIGICKCLKISNVLSAFYFVLYSFFPFFYLLRYRKPGVFCKISAAAGRAEDAAARAAGAVSVWAGEAAVDTDLIYLASESVAQVSVKTIIFHLRFRKMRSGYCRRNIRKTGFL